MTRSTTLLALFVGLLWFAPPAWADFKLERRLALEPGGSFTLDSDTGSVLLAGDASSGATLTLSSRRDDFDELYDVRIDETPGRVAVSVKRRGGWVRNLWPPDLFGDSTHFTIRVPSKTAVTISMAGGAIDAERVSGSLAVRTSGGSLRVDAVQGSVDGRTSGGSIHMRDIRGDVVARTSGGGIDITSVTGSLRATTSGGGIDIDGVTGDLYASTSGGGVQIRGAGGRVEARTSGGPVDVGFAAGNNRGGVLSTSGGGVRTEIDPRVALTIDASSSGGRVNSDLPVTVQGVIGGDDADWKRQPFGSGTSLRGDLNGGGPVLRLRSSGGGVRISGAR